jgi:hypothetical protein
MCHGARRSGIVAQPALERQGSGLRVCWLGRAAVTAFAAAGWAGAGTDAPRP